MKTTIEKAGRITYPYGYQPEPHELDTANVFAALGKDIEFIRPSRTQNSHTPDIMMDGILWEIKCPMGKHKKNIANVFRRAVKQSKYIIIDIRKIKISEEEAVTEVQRNAKLVKSLKKLKVVGEKDVIDIK